MTRPAPAVHPGTVVRIRNERWRVITHVRGTNATWLTVHGCDVENHGIRTCFLLPFEQVSPVAAAERRPRAVHLARWRHVARRALACASPEWTSLRTAARANIDLLPFQLEPALALTRGLACRFLIADEVGLGKTIQAGLMVAEVLARAPGGRALIITPASLKQQWRDEMQERFHLSAVMFDAGTLARSSAFLPPTVNPWATCTLAIASIDYVKRPDVMRSLETLVWDVLVLDEAHALAGRSDRATAARTLGGRARHVVMLTATPHSGDEDAFQRLREVGDLDHGFPLLTFRRTRADVGIGASRKTTLLPVRLGPAESTMHRLLLDYGRLVWRQSQGAAGMAARLAVVVLAKRACSSAASLLRSVERRLSLLADDSSVSTPWQAPLPHLFEFADDEEPDVDLRAPGLRNYPDERRWLERIATWARRAARTEGKIRVLRRLIARTSEPTIVFTEYRDTLERLAAALSPVETVLLHGGLSPSERALAAQRFTHGQARLLLATDAASEGLNLHARCRLVVSLELPWTPVRLEQRIGRVDRLGQLRRVHALNLVAKDTSETSVLARLHERRGRAAAGLASALGAQVHETRVAESIFDDRECADLGAPGPVPPAALSACDLTPGANAEAHRLATARLLWPSDRGGEPDIRPAATVVRRADRTRQSARIWVFRAHFTAGEDGRLVWESLVGLWEPASRPCPGRAAEVGRALDPRRTPVRQASVMAHEALLDALDASLRKPVGLMGDRERAIVRALQHLHARLSSELIQRGLFDRRVERATAAQSALLEAALGQCQNRLHALDLLRQLRAGDLQLAFALAID